jgi:hypothetical protein
LTVGKIYEVLPFGNTLNVMEYAEAFGPLMRPKSTGVTYIK